MPGALRIGDIAQMNAMERRLEAALHDKTARVAVVGCGYVGLALLMGFAKAGFHVTAVDTSAERMEQLSRGESYLMDVATPDVLREVTAGRIVSTTDFASLRDIDVIFICVPTPFDRAKAPDLSYIRSAAESIVPHLRAGQLVVLESTTYPGTTEEVLLPILERSGLKAGKDFWLAFSPERIDPGSRTATIANTPKVVGGLEPVSTRLAVTALRQVVAEAEVHPVSNPRVAELTKLLENVFRSVNIALVNELAQLCDRMGIDVWEVIEAAKTKPYGFMPFYPGPGVGGHCIPVDPYYLSWKAREYDFPMKFIELAAETNQAMPFFAADKLRRMLSVAGVSLRGAQLLVIGAAFKRDIDDARNSAAIRTMEVLRSEGAIIRYHDPHIPEIRLARSLFSDNGEAETLKSADLTLDEVSRADVTVILVGHTRVDYDLIQRSSKRIFDAVNAIPHHPEDGRTVVRL